MSGGLQFACDMCGKEKRKTNHWFLAYLAAGQGLVVGQWNDDVATDADVLHLCGNNCVHKLVERYLETGSTEPPRKAAGDSASIVPRPNPEADDALGVPSAWREKHHD